MEIYFHVQFSAKVLNIFQFIITLSQNSQTFFNVLR